MRIASFENGLYLASRSHCSCAAHSRLLHEHVIKARASPENQSCGYCFKLHDF